MSVNSKLYMSDTVKYLNGNDSLGPYHRCQVINSQNNLIQYAEFTESQLTIAINRARKHQYTKCLYGDNSIAPDNTKQNFIAKFFSNLFK